MWNRKQFVHNGEEYFVTITEYTREEWYKASKPSYIDCYQCVVEKKRTNKKWYQRSFVKIASASYDMGFWLDRHKELAIKTIEGSTFRRETFPIELTIQM